MNFSLVDLQNTFETLSESFPDESIRKRYFLSVCYLLEPNLDLEYANRKNPFGGKIGRGDSQLEHIFGRSKLFRLHAVLHDAAGYVRARSGRGPGYCYLFQHFPINCCFLGHLLGLVFCTYAKLFHCESYNCLRL